MKWIVIVGILVFMVACAPQSTPEQQESQDELQETAESVQPANLEGWRSNPLTDVRTGETFRVSDFVGKPILLESFAVWCPTCTAQQQETKKLIEQTGDAYVHISLDTDPNEDEQIVRDHIESHGFDWHYAVSPAQNTQSLIQEFGIGVVNAPSVPMILICPDQSTYFLGRGVKTAATLIDEIESTCDG